MKKRVKRAKKVKTEIKCYEVRVICRNCGHAYTIKVPCGTTISTFVRDLDCINCKCTGDLHRRLLSYIS